MRKPELEIYDPEVHAAEFARSLDLQVRATTVEMVERIQEVHNQRSKLGHQLLLVESDTPDYHYVVRYAALYEALKRFSILDAYFNVDPDEYQDQGKSGWQVFIRIPRFSTILQISQNEVHERPDQERTTIFYRAA